MKFAGIKVCGQKVCPTESGMEGLNLPTHVCLSVVMFVWGMQQRGVWCVCMLQGTTWGMGECGGNWAGKGTR